MPAPMNAHLTPPPNTWEGGQFKVPDGVMQMLAQRQGGAPMMGAGGGAPGGGGWSQYGMMYPDVMAGWQRESANPKNTFSNADDFFKWHYNQFGQKEGRQAPGGVLGQLGAPQTGMAPKPDNRGLLGQLLR
jgi:hypothetical protein